ncbi:hypothetical protein RJ639_043210 [Escallonia herrerae]|uniref:Uncharacterized protein n=1 Tax=Escallonia herrerae TaxID=1293975 RepID=A0AA89B8D0_9ASTE|nr:hypothetical protein RJ639_043210 [Escallonia herrerae]
MGSGNMHLRRLLLVRGTKAKDRVKLRVQVLFVRGATSDMVVRVAIGIRERVSKWLRCTGSVTGGGASGHHFASSHSHSDVTSSMLFMRNRTYRSINDKDSPCSAFLDRSTLCNARHYSSSNGVSKHPYSSFARSHRDKTRDKGKNRSFTRNSWDYDYSYPLGNILASRVDNITLCRSQSMVSRKLDEALSPRALGDSSGSKHYNANGVTSEVSTTCDIKAAFKRIISLPIGNSGFISGEGWTSALAEVPAVIGSSSCGPTSVPQTVSSTPTSLASSATVGLNMAEALSKAPPRVPSATQLPDKSQRLEELAVKQSRQLIPMKPLMPKPLVPNSSNKAKQPKAANRTSETLMASKSAAHLQPHSSQLANQSVRGGQVKSDASMTNVGKFYVLKPLWDYGASSLAKDASTIINGSSRVENSQPAVHPSAPAAPLTGQNYLKPLNLRSALEKRPSLSQAQSRSDFFNLMKKKTLANSSAILLDSGAMMENSGCVLKEVVSSRVTGNGSKITNKVMPTGRLSLERRI